MYKSNKGHVSNGLRSRIKTEINEKFFEIRKGVKQGNPLSS